jgi:hypothetical protein
MTYMESEYGVTPAEWSKAAKKLHIRAREAIKSGQSSRFTGNIEDALWPSESQVAPTTE